jgi:malate dehydrogenase (oxaloacetate-decarboxylating)(NADP+)
MSVKPRRSLRGTELLRSSALNKGTAFTAEERHAYKLDGLLPPAIEIIEQQVARAFEQLSNKITDLERYIYLTALLDANETLFYRVVMSDPAQFLPIVYAPTVGEACLKFGHIYRQPRGLYVSIAQRKRLRQVLKNWPARDVRFICVSTGERILGLGDLGSNGMGIPIGKLQLYTACAAVPPRVLLPVLLDCGTNNRDLLQDPLYLGLRKLRPGDDEMTAFVDEFMETVQEVFPHCCVHFEDWKGIDAVRFLERYRDRMCCFNDDIQGTGSVTVAGLINAARFKRERLSDQRVLFLGAGAAGLGMADMIVAGMRREGLSERDARARIAMVDMHGLLQQSRHDLSPEQHRYAIRHAPNRDLVEVVRSLKPTTLIGVSTVGKAFNQQVIEEMSHVNRQPIIFALSNPTDHAECSAAEAYTWSQGKAIYAAGVQFPPVLFGGNEYIPSQLNNFYVFPAIGLAVYATMARRVTDEMFIAAANATADQVSLDRLERGLLFPPQSNVLETEICTATRIAEVVFEQGLAGVERPPEIEPWLRNLLYEPKYREYV